MNSWYEEASTGRVGFSGEVTDPLTIPPQDITTSGTCNLDNLYDNIDGIYNAAHDAAQAAGYDPDSYDHMMIDVSNAKSPCRYGFGEVGGSVTWMFDRLTIPLGQSDLPEHEIGHNLGLYHSHGFECGSSILTETCRTSAAARIEYGNVFDPMGSNTVGFSFSAVGDFGASQLAQLGWLNEPEESVSLPGQFTLSALEATSPADPQALVLHTPMNLDYWFELRRPIGLDSFLSRTSSPVGVLVNVIDEDYAASDDGDPGPFLLDMTPTTSTDPSDFFDASLQPGTAFEDPDGAFSVYVSAADTTSASLTFAGPGPTVFGFAPASGPVGTAVAIVGAGFTGAKAVTFNGTSAQSFTVQSDTRITAVVPPGATSGPIAVTTPGGTVSSTDSFTVLVPTPAVQSFSPTKGPAGTIVTVKGTHLTGASAVAFGGTEAQAFAVDSDTQVTAVVALGTATGPIAVTTLGGVATSSKSFIVIPSPAPQISKTTPAKAEPGTRIQIRGKGFSGATEVEFAGVDASDFTVSGTVITATVPFGATTGPITVIGPGGSATSKAAFTVLSHPGFASCLSTGEASVPVGTEPLLSEVWEMASSSYLKPFLSSASTTLTIDGRAVKKPGKFWEKKGEANGTSGWMSRWVFDTGSVLASPGDSMTIDFHVVATKTFSDGSHVYSPGSELMPGPTCTIDAG